MRRRPCIVNRDPAAGSGRLECPRKRRGGPLGARQGGEASVPARSPQSAARRHPRFARTAFHSARCSSVNTARTCWRVSARRTEPTASRRCGRPGKLESTVWNLRYRPARGGRRPDRRVALGRSGMSIRAAPGRLANRTSARPCAISSESLARAWSTMTSEWSMPTTRPSRSFDAQAFNANPGPEPTSSTRCFESSPNKSTVHSFLWRLDGRWAMMKPAKDPSSPRGLLNWLTTLERTDIEKPGTTGSAH